ncbi:hypothetical protein RJ640_011546 [Escallonia rubra]|uniref:PRA1 family protein n=1 Tax=Escallonia rubra TaxID=112253 RepID=A0AA88QT34_9ASTE|nr:hypothetical protein RJ640_011546 [Escallonia rubra]
MSSTTPIPDYTPATGPPPTTAFDIPTTTARIRNSFAANLRPWGSLLSPSALSIPTSLTEASLHLRLNLHHFRLNYALLLLAAVLLSLLGHPLSLFVALLTVLLWLFLYLFRNDDLVVFNYTLDDRVVFVGLIVVTLFALILTGVWVNLGLALLIGGGVIGCHAALRIPEDFDDQESPFGALLGVVDSPRGSYSRV